MNRQIFLLLLLATWAVIPKANSDETAEKPAKREAPSAVVLTIDYGDGVQKRFTSIPWKKGMTVLDALIWAGKHPRGIQVRHRGQGTLAMVSQIDDLKNGGGQGKNWIYYVNHKLAERSCGDAAVSTGDKILWRFEVYR